MKIVAIFLFSYVVFGLGLESAEDESRRFVPMYPYSETNTQDVPEDPSLIPVKAPKELVLEVGKRSKLLKEARSSITKDVEEQRKLKESGQYWDRFWTEPLKEGRRIDSEVSEPRNEFGKEVSPSLQPSNPDQYSMQESGPTPVVPDVPQSIAENPSNPDPSVYAQSYVPQFSVLNFGNNEHDDIEVKTVPESPALPTAEIIDNSPSVKDDDSTPTARPNKNDKEHKSKKSEGKPFLSLPGAEIQGSVKAKLVPGTKLYKLMKNAQKKLGENYQPKLLYVVNNY